MTTLMINESFPYRKTPYNFDRLHSEKQLTSDSKFPKLFIWIVVKVVVEKEE
jgi:hypothetical protein